VAEEITQIANSKLIPLNQVLMTDFTLQFSLAILIVGFIAIFWINRGVASWIEKKKISCTRPFATEFVKKVFLSLFAIALFVSIDAYIQIFELFDTQMAIDAANAYETLTPRETFAKILDTIVILIIGYTIVNLIPIILSINEAKKIEKANLNKITKETPQPADFNKKVSEITDKIVKLRMDLKDVREKYYRVLYLLYN
jgi:hypothetical protein